MAGNPWPWILAAMAEAPDDEGPWGRPPYAPPPVPGVPDPVALLLLDIVTGHGYEFPPPQLRSRMGEDLFAEVGQAPDPEGMGAIQYNLPEVLNRARFERRNYPDHPAYRRWWESPFLRPQTSPP